MANPYDECVTLDRVFVDSPNLGEPYSFLRNVITDNNFHDRTRMGRLLAFMARLAQDGWTPAARAIAVDELTALLVDAQGMAKVVDQRTETDRGSVCFLQAPGLPQHCRPKAPLAYDNVGVYQVRAGDPAASFDLRAWQGQGAATTVCQQAKERCVLRSCLITVRDSGSGPFPEESTDTP